MSVRRRRRWLARLIGALLLAATSAFGAPPAAQSESELSEAKFLFVEGNALRKNGDVRGALELYLRSRELVPSVSNTINAAYCLNQLERYDEALDLYEELPRRFPNELSDEERRSLAPVLSALRRRVGSLGVSANTVGLLLIDGRPRGRLPLLTPVRVMPGKRTVRVVSEGWESFERVVFVKANEMVEIDARLTPLLRSGRLRVEAPDPEIVVYVDGAPVGRAPWEGSLRPGVHLYAALGPERGSSPALVRVIEGQLVRVSPSLEPLGAEFDVLSEPRSAEISIDGVAVGKGSWRGRLPRGEHVFEAREVGYQLASLRLDPSTQKDVRLDLSADPAHPRWGRAKGTPIGVSTLIGPTFAPSLGSGAEQSCERYRCATNGVAYGVFVSARVAYELSQSASLEAGVGYARFEKSLERTIFDSFELDPNGPPLETEYSLKDEILLHGPILTLGARYRRLLAPKLELSAGGHVGLWLASASDQVSGSVSGAGQTQPVRVQGSATKLRFGDIFAMLEVRLTRHFGNFGLGGGLALLAFLLEGSRNQHGDTLVAGSCDDVLSCAPGERFVAQERTHAQFFSAMPYAVGSFAF